MSGEPPGGPDQENPSNGNGRRSGRDPGAVVAGALLGFIAWGFAWAFVFFESAMGGTSSTVDPLLTWTFVGVFLGAVGLIVWPRTRRLGQGFLLGLAIGLVVAGGLCLPALLPSS